ncbi:regulator [Amnibacterium sp. CER49]|uniref:nucleotide-binding protein n=1 Tax=Amnibacterium sp. CER49 TaxID=3039161 RepID=UPI00244924C9|nr:P-loop NTPase [Amnibacterium sp. CER49]MDH2442942.1 regulator [Amnibacterium sp. CER49]
MTELLLSLTPQVEDRLLPQLVDAGVAVAARPATAVEAIAALGRLAVDGLLASASPRHLDAALVQAVRTRGLPLVVLAGSRAEREHAQALGLADVLDADGPLDAALTRLREPLAAVVRRSDPDEPEGAPVRSRGRVISVWGPTGAPGRTTTAIALAAELAATGARVALVDADTLGASIAPALGLLDEAPGLAAACRLAAAGTLSATELDRVAQAARGSRGDFAVLTGIGRPARWPELSHDRVTKVLEQCRDWADVTVVDAGFNLEADEEIVSDLFAPRRNAATLAAVQAADTVVAVAAGDPVGLARFVRAYGDLVETVDPSRVKVLVTKVRASAVGLGAASQIRASLLRFGGIDDVTLVPDDAKACDAALLTARPLPEAAPRSAATTALRRFVADELAGRAAPAARRGLLRHPALA